MISEFQFVAVLVAIIFGLSLTHVMSSGVRVMLSGLGERQGVTRLVWTCFVLIVLLVNWWVTFSWQFVENWSFDIYLVFTTWAGCHYALAIALFPYSGLGTEIQVKGWTPRPFLGVFLVLSLLDFAQTALRGELYAAVFYVPFTLHYVVLVAGALALNKEKVYQYLAWYMMTSLFWWAIIARRFIG